MIEPYKSQAITNLKKARGQIDRILKMLEEGNYCMNVAQQVNAGIGLLKKTNSYILESHLLTCGEKKFGSDAETKQKFIQEIIRICNVTSR